MRARLYTPRGNLGFVDLVDGVEVADVVRAMREHRLFITPVEPVAPLQAATTLPDAVNTALPGDETIDEIGGRSSRKRVRQ
jgi:hypothetical protein